jgi:hypothetical protein
MWWLLCVQLGSRTCKFGPIYAEKVDDDTELLYRSLVVGASILSLPAQNNNLEKNCTNKSSSNIKAVSYLHRTLNTNLSNAC